MMKIEKFIKCFFVSAVFIMLYLPILIIIILSFNDNQSGNSLSGFTFNWYIEIFTVKTLYTSILNSLLIAIYSTIIATVLGVFAAIGINSLSKKRKKQILLLNNVPMLNSEIVTGISIMLVFTLLLPLFPNIFGFTTMLVAHVFFTTPYVILSVLPKLRETDESLFEAACDLGVSPLKALYLVVLPCIKTGIITGALLAFTMSIDDFVISYFTSGNGFTNFSNWIYGKLGRKEFSPAAYAYNSLLTITTLLVVLIPNIKAARKGGKK